MAGDEVQVTALVMACVLPSLNVPVAAHPRVDAGARTALGGVTEMETNAAELTASCADAVIPSNIALMLATPGDTDVTKLTDPIVATAGLSDVHVTSRVMVCVLASLNVPVAPKESVVAGAMVRPTGVTEIDVRVALVTESVDDAADEPSVAVIVAEPGVRPRASPLELPTFAMPVSDEVHVDCAVRSWVLPSLNVPIAESCWLVVAAIVVSPGRIASEARLAALTVAMALPLTELEAAVIVEVPRLRAVASPLTVMEAMLVFEELQVAVPVMSCVEPSENVPVAVNCCNVPSGIDGVAGATAMEVTLAPVTMRLAVEKTLPELAMIVALPAAIPTASPGAPFTLMLATAGFPEVHCTEPLMFCVLPSVNVPAAVNCALVLWAIEIVKGVIAIDTTAALVAVRLALEEMLPEAAVIVDNPRPTASASPNVELALIATADGLPDVHCTDAVISLRPPSVNAPVAVSWTVVPKGSDEVDGETRIEASTAALTVSVVLPLLPE